MAPVALDLMLQFDWPGNVRELENEIERALTLAGDEREITPEYLSEKIAGPREEMPKLDGSITLQAAVEKLERQMVSRALKTSSGNRSQAARMLGLTRQGLLNKINRYRIA
jgi:Nif-specific regulatory protein